jgi:hypothetical protein
MKFAEFFLMKRILAGASLFLLVGGPAPLMPSAAPPSRSTDSLRQTKSWAESQHEIIMLHLKKKEYEKASMEANKLFDITWPESEEPVLLKELLFLSDQFLREGQAPRSLQMIERNSRHFRKTSSMIAILKEQGYLYKSLNQNDRALEFFRKAQELEQK